MITAIIVDDDEVNRDSLEKMIDQYFPDVQIIGKADSVQNTKKLLKASYPDILFLDIEMPNGNGFELLTAEISQDMHVIFTTAHAEYAIKAIKFAAFDYLLKPINLNELKAAVEKAINAKSRHNSNNILSNKISILQDNHKNGKYDFKKIALPSVEGLEFYETKNILRCEADRAYCNFYTTNGKKIVVSKPLKEFEDILAECNFFRVHKSNMVNLTHIKKYVRGNGGYVILSDDSLVTVSVRRKEELMTILSKF